MTGGWVAVALAGVLGLALGSFLNVCALRWPNDESVVSPPSRCPGCRTRLRWHDNVPVLSWILLKGRCRACSERVSVQYPLVELTTGFVWAGAFGYYGIGMEALRIAVFLTILLGIAVSDARFYIIPDQFSVGGTLLGVAFAAVAPGIALVESVSGAALGFGLLWFVAWAGEKAFKKEAMGGGDIKMMAMVGAFLGMTGVVLTLFLGALLGSVIFGPISLRTGKLVPFGIFLAAGAVATAFLGDPFLDWYWTWATGG